MSSPLNIMKATKRLRDSNIKAGRRPPRMRSPPHPLDSSDNEDHSSDSEADSVLDTSCSESISSAATSDTSCACATLSNDCIRNPTTCRQSAVLSTVLVSSIAAVSLKPLLERQLSSIKLADLLKYSRASQTELANIPLRYRLSHKFPKVSNLSVWQAFLALFVNYPLRSGSQEDITDTFPGNDSMQTAYSDSIDERTYKELETFAASDMETTQTNPSRAKARNREFRMNCNFLKRYALDCSARINKVLPTDPEDVELLVCHPLLRLFDAKHGLNRISEMSRDKLWDSVVLPPRTDSCPRTTINPDTYICLNNESRKTSIVSKIGRNVPWAAHRNFMKPAGRLVTSACLGNGSSPTLGKTYSQYTVKGWQNERWVPVSF